MRNFELVNDMKGSTNSSRNGRSNRQQDNVFGGWVLKAPFTTNSKGIAWCSTLLEVMVKFRKMCNREDLSNVPYFILQPRLNNRMVS